MISVAGTSYHRIQAFSLATPWSPGKQKYAWKFMA
jgi:hypothetical protein